MFIGHLAVALAAKKPAPKASLGTLFMAAQFPDLVWPLLLLLGVERVQIAPGNTVVTPLTFVHYPFTHSLLMAAVWATLFSVLYKILKHDSNGAKWIWLAVISHWVLDAISHRPDLPLYPGSRILVGLGLWNSLAGTIAVEVPLFFLGAGVYVKTTRAKDKTGGFAFWSLIVFLILIYFANLFGPPPANVEVIAVMGLSGWLLVLWGYWIDRHRQAIDKASCAVAGK